MSQELLDVSDDAVVIDSGPAALAVLLAVLRERGAVDLPRVFARHWFLWGAFSDDRGTLLLVDAERAGADPSATVATGIIELGPLFVRTALCSPALEAALMAGLSATPTGASRERPPSRRPCSDAAPRRAGPWRSPAA